MSDATTSRVTKQQHEETSPLLHEALSYMKDQRRCHDDDDDFDWLFGPEKSRNNPSSPLRNVLILRLFLMEPSIVGRCTQDRNEERKELIRLWQKMTRVCNEVNDMLRQWTSGSRYPWFSGRCCTLGAHDSLPAPDTNSPPSLARLVVEPHTSHEEEGEEEVLVEKIPHLCGVVRYGSASVEDEWTAIALLWHFSAHNKPKSASSWAIHIWDVDDGDLLGMEVACEMEREDEENTGPLSCWIKDGQLWMVPSSSSESWRESLQSLQSSSGSNQASVAPIRMQQCLKRRLDRYIQWSSSLSSIPQNPTFVNAFRSVMVLPRPVARWIGQEPHLVTLAIRAYCRHVQNMEDNNNNDSTAAMHAQPRIPLEDLVVMAVPTSRTLYAMLLTTQATSTSSSPSSLEMWRMQQWCQEEVRAAKFGDALVVGQRLCRGLELFFLGQKSKKTQPHVTPPSQPQHWLRLLDPQGDYKEDAAEFWLSREALRKEFEQCPVLEPEWLRSTCSYLSLWPEFLRRMRNDDDDDEHDEHEFAPPRPNEVDDAHEWLDDWTQCQTEMMSLWSNCSSAGGGADSARQGSTSRFVQPALDASFTQPTSTTGAAAKSTNDTLAMEPSLEEPIRIQPRLFVELLVKALQDAPPDSKDADKQDEDTLCKLVDGFFSAEDYQYFLQHDDEDEQE